MFLWLDICPKEWASQIVSYLKATNPSSIAVCGPYLMSQQWCCLNDTIDLISQYEQRGTTNNTDNECDANQHGFGIALQTSSTLLLNHHRASINSTSPQFVMLIDSSHPYCKCVVLLSCICLFAYFFRIDSSLLMVFYYSSNCQ